jgi:hypothetical protein
MRKNKRILVREIIPQDPFNIAVRTKMASEIRAAKKTLQISAGDITDYDFLDLRVALEETAERRIIIDICTVNPDRNLSERMLAFGINVYAVKGVDKSFIIRDGVAVTISFSRAENSKTSYFWSDNPSDIRKYRSNFLSLKKPAMKLTSTGRDPWKELFAHS